MKLFQHYIIEAKAKTIPINDDGWFELFWNKADGQGGQWKNTVKDFVNQSGLPSSQIPGDIRDFFIEKNKNFGTSQFKEAAIRYTKNKSKQLKSYPEEKKDFKILQDFFSDDLLKHFYSTNKKLFFKEPIEKSKRNPKNKTDDYTGYFSGKYEGSVPNTTTEISGKFPWDGFKLSGSELTSYNNFWKSIENDLSLDMKALEKELKDIEKEIDNLIKNKAAQGKIDKKQEEYDEKEKPFFLNSSINELQTGEYPLPYMSKKGKQYSLDLSGIKNDVHAQWIFNQIQKVKNIKTTDRITILEDFSVLYNIQSLAKLNNIKDNQGELLSIFGKSSGDISKVALSKSSISDYISAREKEVSDIEVIDPSKKGAIKARKNALRDKGLLIATKAQDKAIEKQIEDTIDIVIDAIEIFRKDNLSSAITDDYPTFKEFQDDVVNSIEYIELIDKIPLDKRADFKKQLWDNLIRPAYNELKEEDRGIKNLLKDDAKRTEFLKKAGIRDITQKLTRKYQDKMTNAMPTVRASKDAILEPVQTQEGKTGIEWLESNKVKTSQLVSSIQAGRSSLSVKNQGKVDEELNSILTAKYSSYDKFESVLKKKINSLSDRINKMIEKKKELQAFSKTERKTFKANVYDGLGNLQDLMGASSVYDGGLYGENTIISEILKRHKLK